MRLWEFGCVIRLDQDGSRWSARFDLRGRNVAIGFWKFFQDYGFQGASALEIRLCDSGRSINNNERLRDDGMHMRG
jgi:hypothetical protein